MAAATSSQSIKTNPSKRESYVSHDSLKAVTINNSVHKIYTESRDNLSAAAIYNEKRKNGVFSMPGYPTIGVPTHSSGLKAANLANASNPSPKIWQPDKTPEAFQAAVMAKDKAAPPKKGRESISGSGKSASSAALSAHGVSGRDTAANALPDAYTWGDRSNSITSSNRGVSLVGATHVHSATAPINTRPGKSKTPSFTSISNNKIPDSNYLQNIGSLQEAAQKKAEDRLSKLYKPSSIANAGDGAACLAITASREEESRKQEQDREALLLASQQHEALMAVARGRAEQKISKIDEEVFYKNPTLNLKYYTAALAVAEEKGKDRMVNHGKIDIGGGKFMSQSDIDAIAERNVRPVINEISEKAQAQRQVDEERRQAEEEEKRKKAEDKRIEQEQKIADRRALNERKAADKAIKNEEKAKSKAQWDAIKAEEREKKASEKAARDKEKSEQRAVIEQKRAEERDAKVLQKSKLKEEKRLFAVSRRSEKLALKTAVAATAVAVAQAKEAESLAHAEVQKFNALKLTAETKLESARLAESHAESEAQAEKARAEAALAQSEIAKAEAQAKEAEARQVEAEAEKARAEAEAEKAKENQRIGEEEAKKQEEKFDQREAELKNQQGVSEDGNIDAENVADTASRKLSTEDATETSPVELAKEGAAKLDESVKDIEEHIENPEDISKVSEKNEISPLVIVPNVNGPVENEIKPTETVEGIEKGAISEPQSLPTVDAALDVPKLNVKSVDIAPTSVQDATADNASVPVSFEKSSAKISGPSGESSEQLESLLNKPAVDSKNLTSSVVSIKSGAPGTSERPAIINDSGINSIAENKETETEPVAAADATSNLLGPNTAETGSPVSPTIDATASPISPSKERRTSKTKSFFNKVKSKAKEEFSSLKSSTKDKKLSGTTKNQRSKSTNETAPAGATVSSSAVPASDTEKKVGIASKTDANHGGVSAASAARAALGQPAGEAEASATGLSSSRAPLERTFSGFSQGSAEDEKIETPAVVTNKDVGDDKKEVANVTKGGDDDVDKNEAETGSKPNFFFSEDTNSIKGEAAATT
ncbi:hypothetical protein D0Z03_002159 [Geotrichum reessii]|nr:hypothetical protein D0Z03_002159 [Galactomyces reessii]